MLQEKGKMLFFLSAGVGKMRRIGSLMTGMGRIYTENPFSPA